MATLKMRVVVTLTVALLYIIDTSFACPDEEHSFYFSWDRYASETGYFKVEGYNGVEPVLTLKLGETYTFYQTNESNWFHPLGFAYAPDGAHLGEDELEEAVGNGDAPQYYIDGELVPLDTYEPRFSYPFGVWSEQSHKVELTVTDPNVHEIFYFCHIHAGMSGRIIIEGGNNTINYQPKELYDYYEADEFDSACGTWEVSDYGPAGNQSCNASDYICIDPGLKVNETESQFVQCMAALDCKMHEEMNSVYSGDMVATFMQQMIPHHQNAVNMAKTLLKLGGNLEQEVHDMMVDIINGQNSQVTFMRSWLKENGQSEWEMCDGQASR